MRAKVKRFLPCTECGTILSTQTIPKESHADGNNDIVCDDCEKIITEKIIVRLSTPSVRTVSYGKAVKIYAYANILPEGYKIKWKVEGSGISIKPSESGSYCVVTSIVTGKAVVKAYVVDEKGNIILNGNNMQICDSEYFYSEANIWLRIVEFFKNLFGLKRTIV